MVRSITSILFATGLLVAFTARAGDVTCVTACQEKMNLCAAQCGEKSGAELGNCQLGCSKLLFVECFQQCSETGVVNLNDYEIAVPIEVISAPEEGAEQAPPGRERAEDRKEASQE